MKRTPIDYDPFAHGEIGVTAPTTEAQREIWMSVQMGVEANCAFNESLSLHLHGELNIPALLAALQALLQRHESLRMTMSADGSLLCINQSQPLNWSVVDLSSKPIAERDAHLTQLRRDAVTTPFDLKYGPLFRAQLVQLSAKTFLLILTAHHIICDGWSWGVLIPELGTLYSAYRDGLTPDLPEPDRMSLDANAQAEEQYSPDALATLNYWCDQFRDRVPVLELPTDAPRPWVRTFTSDRVDWELDPQVFAQLKQLANQSGASFFTLLWASFEIFLHRLTGQQDLVIGLPVAAQALRDQPRLVGHAVHLLPIRAQIHPPISFSAYLNHRRGGLLDAYDHPNLTFGQLVSQLSLQRDPSRIPLVAVTFNLDKGFEAEQLPFAGLAVACQTNPRAFETFELAVNFTEYRYRLLGEWQFNTDLFQRATIQDWTQRYTTLLRELINNPQTPVSLSNSTDTTVKPPPPPSSPDPLLPPFSPPTSLTFSPHFSLETQLIQLWETLLHVSPIGIHDNFFTLGGNSMLAIQCFAWLENQLGQKIPITTLFQTPTIAGLVQTLQARGWAANWSSLVPIQAMGTQPPFFCVHPHGGTVLCYRDLARHLDPNQPFYGLQARGLDGTEPTLGSIEAMATSYLEEICTIQPHGPYYLGGFCVGGFIAYEMAQQLLQAGEMVGLLLAIDTAPTLVTEPEFSEKDIGFYWQNLRGRLQNRGVRGVLKAVGDNLARNLTGTLNPDLEQFDRMWQAHTRVITRYRPQPYPGCLTLIQSEEWHTLYPTFQKQWQQWASQVRYSVVPGIHDQLLEEPMVIRVAEQVSRVLHSL